MSETMVTSDQDVAPLPKLELPPGAVYCADHPLTVEEFYELVDEDTSAELIDGVIVMATPASYQHEALCNFINCVLRLFTEQRRLGTVLGSRTPVRINPRTAREPDVLFVRADRLGIIHAHEIVGPPDLIVEIVSPNDARREIITKQAQYEALGVPELWMIDFPRRRATVYQLNEAGQYTVAAQGEHGTLRSTVVPGFALEADWFWAAPDALPAVWTVVQTLLTGT